MLVGIFESRLLHVVPAGKPALLWPPDIISGAACYCDKSPGGVVVMIPQSLTLLSALLIHSDKGPFSLIGSSALHQTLQVKMAESLNSVNLIYKLHYAG